MIIFSKLISLPNSSLLAVLNENTCPPDWGTFLSSLFNFPIFLSCLLLITSSKLSSIVWMSADPLFFEAFDFSSDRVSPIFPFLLKRTKTLTIYPGLIVFPLRTLSSTSLS